MATAMRVECHEESDGFGGKSDGNEGGNNQLAMGVCDEEVEGGKAMAMGIRVAGEEGDGDGGKSDGDEGGGRATAKRAMATEGKQQSTSDGIDKGGRWLARERRRGDHTTTKVGDDERQERAADDDGSNEEGEGGQGDGGGNEGGGQQRGQGR